MRRQGFAQYPCDPLKGRLGTTETMTRCGPFCCGPQAVSTFIGLLYVGSLFDPRTRVYRHPRHARYFQQRELDGILLSCHCRMFELWMELPAAAQAYEILQYLHVFEAVRFSLPYMPAYFCAVPASATGGQRQTFGTTLKMALNGACTCPPETTDWRILSAIDWIEASGGASSVTLGDIAIELRTSPRWLAHAFLTSIGVSFRHYLRGSRMRRAAHLLFDRWLTVQEVAVLSGYNDPSNFGHDFYSVFHTSPNAFRAPYLAGCGRGLNDYSTVTESAKAAMRRFDEPPEPAYRACGSYRQ